MSAADVDAFLAKVPETPRTTLGIVRDRLRALLPEAEEAIYYGVPAFKIGKIGVAGYASAKNHCSYYPMSGSVLPEIADELVGLDWGRGTLRFPLDEPLSEQLLGSLVTTRLRQAGLR